MWAAVGFGAYLVVLAWLALRASRTAGESELEYYLAGRSLGSWIVALSAVASGRSAWLLLGMTGLAWHYGVAAVWFLPGYIVAELLLFAGPAGRFRRAAAAGGDVTVGDYFASRFPAWGRSLRLVFAASVIVFLTAYVSAQLVAGGKGMDRAFHLGDALGGAGATAGLWATAAVVLVYVVAGGFRAVSWTDAAQVTLMLFALVVLPVTAIISNGGLGPLLDKLLAEGSLSPLAFGGPLVLTGLAVGLGSPGNPHILVRYMSARDERRLTRAALVGTAWNVLMGWGALWTGLAARQVTQKFSIVDGKPQGMVLGQLITSHSSEDIFPAMAEQYLHPVLFGLVMAALLAAIMSTVDSQVLVVSSAITRDLRRVRGRTPLPDRQAARTGRIASALLILGATLIAHYSLTQEGRGHPGVISGLVNRLVLFAWGGLGAAFGPALLLSLYRRRMSGRAALAAMITGGATACLWKGLLAPAAKPAWLSSIWPWISYELTVAFPLALLAGWLVSLLDPARPAESGA